MLKVSVKDFGPIIEGEVELRPLTIFVGPSNSGKSYLATLIYTLLQQSSPDVLFRGGRIDWLLDAETELESTLTGRASRDALVKWATDPSGKLRDAAPFTGLLSGVQAIVTRVVNQSLEVFREGLNRDLQRCFGGISGLARRASPDTELHVGLDLDRPPLHLGLRQYNGSLATESVSLDMSGASLPVPTGLRLSTRRGTVPNYSRERWTRVLVTGGMAALYAGFPTSSYYLPAARSGIAQGHKAIASILVRQSSFAAIEPLEIPTLSGIITDFISHILTLETGRFRPEAPPKSRDVVDFLEGQVLRGKIDIEQQARLTYPEIYYEPFSHQPATGKFPLSRTSSMVSELAPVILFLKYLVNPGDLVVLEEPESHLHPAAQRQMARGIARLVNSGVKVLITTHSDYFVGQLNNLMRFSVASTAKRRKEGYSAADCLDVEKVACYQFALDEEKEGSFVKQLLVTAQEGIPEVEFQGVAEALYEEVLSLQRVRGK